LIRPVVLEEDGEAGVAGSVQRGRAAQLVVQLWPALDEKGKALVGVVDDLEVPAKAGISP